MIIVVDKRADGKSYFKQKAHSWVTIAVLVGGLATAFIIYMSLRVEGDFEKSWAVPVPSYSIENI